MLIKRKRGGKDDEVWKTNACGISRRIYFIGGMGTYLH